ncbi:HAD family hydrolase [Liquorilactobacillus oeni]|uniref:HAD family phosphatase n=1 Tax=Liquorilactobacillus oeni DSM 19972 TaxID=1423777 RepID=A0A0R1MAL7_9LACO|nr:HAD family phosphatase [Liquorilactobacillus oeni]KRL05183.1 hypothetical protein FD46_GL001134 [Liquorilactobacillus oeni DSM 19972]
MKYECILFDMDGTLIESESVYLQLWTEVLAKHGFEVKSADLAQMKGRDSNTNNHLIAQITGSLEQVKELRKEREILLNEAIRHGRIKLKAGMQELLDFLKNNGYYIGVATMSNKQRAESILQSIGVREYFNELTTVEGVKNPKPAPDIYENALQQSGFNKTDTLAIEDTQLGCQAALSAGINVILAGTKKAKIQAIARCRDGFEIIQFLKTQK